jgi:hypothetical protein
MSVSSSKADRSSSVLSFAMMAFLSVGASQAGAGLREAGGFVLAQPPDQAAAPSDSCF